MSVEPIFSAAAAREKARPARSSLRPAFACLAGLMLCFYRVPLFIPFQERAETPQPVDVQSQEAGGERSWRRAVEYAIKARVPIFGDIGHVGSFFIEEEVRRNGETLDRIFRIFGNSTPELARKGQDYCGELKSVKRCSRDSESKPGQPERPAWPEAESLSSGYFKKNGLVESESIVFHPDHAVSMSRNGEEKRIEGNSGSLLSALRYFLEHEIREGDVRETPFILGGHPYVFRCEVGPPTIHKPTRARVFPIDFTTFDGLEKDSRGKPKVSKKKGGVRVWLCKEGPYADVYLRLSVEYRWYLTLQMEYLKAEMSGLPPICAEDFGKGLTRRDASDERILSARDYTDDSDYAPVPSPSTWRCRSCG